MLPFSTLADAIELKETSQHIKVTARTLAAARDLQLYRTMRHVGTHFSHCYLTCMLFAVRFADERVHGIHLSLRVAFAHGPVYRRIK